MSASPIFDVNTGEYLGVDTHGYLKGEILLMDKKKYQELKKARNGDRITHEEALKNSISIGDLPDEKKSMDVWSIVVNKVAKFGFELFYKYDPSPYLAGREIQVFSRKNKWKTRHAQTTLAAGDFAENINFAGDVDFITFNFDRRKDLNTAGNIISLFEHEHYFHGCLDLRAALHDFDVHAVIYKKQKESSIYKYTSGTYRENINEHVQFYDDYYKEQKTKSSKP